MAKKRKDYLYWKQGDIGGGLKLYGANLYYGNYMIRSFSVEDFWLLERIAGKTIPKLPARLSKCPHKIRCIHCGRWDVK